MSKFIIDNIELHEGFEVIDGYDNKYCINRYGQVVSPSHIDKNGNFRKVRVLKPQKRGKGYLYVNLMQNGQQKRVSVHRLVAELFVKNPDSKPQVNHKDGNKLNNFYENLEWCTNQENKKHAFDMGITKPRDCKGELNSMVKLNSESVIQILNSKDTVHNLAEKFNVSRSTIYKIKKRKRWNHVK